MNRLAEEDCKGDLVRHESLLYDDDESEEWYDLARVIHAEVEPPRATVVRNEVDRGLVEEHVLLRKDRILLPVGSDDGRTAHAFVKVRVDGAPEGRTNLVELVVGVQVRLADLSHDPDSETEANDDFPRADSEHD